MHGLFPSLWPELAVASGVSYYNGQGLGFFSQAEVFLMRWNLCYVIGLSISMFFSGWATIAAAQTTTPVKESAHAELVKTLRHAHWLLVHADHDYGGHREKAVKEVHKALEDLGYQHKKAEPGSTPATGTVAPPQTVHGGQPKMHKPQGSSDDQMREARKHLDRTLKHLSAGGKHPKATANVQAAIAEINTALRSSTGR